MYDEIQEMTLYEFNMLDDYIKEEYVRQHCNHIGNVIIDKSTFMLYGS
jgi:hypothetical protein